MDARICWQKCCFCTAYPPVRLESSGKALACTNSNRELSLEAGQSSLAPQNCNCFDERGTRPMTKHRLLAPWHSRMKWMVRSRLRSFGVGWHKTSKNASCLTLSKKSRLGTSKVLSGFLTCAPNNLGNSLEKTDSCGSFASESDRVVRRDKAASRCNFSSRLRAYSPCARKTWFPAPILPTAQRLLRLFQFTQKSISFFLVCSCNFQKTGKRTCNLSRMLSVWSKTHNLKVFYLHLGNQYLQAFRF